MDDRQIIGLYWARDQRAIAQTAEKYGNYLYTISKNIVFTHEDAEECVQDTYTGAWNAMPPHKPDSLKIFLAKLTRRISITKRRYLSADKRKDSRYDIALSELESAFPDRLSIDEQVESREISRVINDFVRSLNSSDRQVFVLRYFYLEPLKSISAQMGCSESKIKSQLFRLRKKLAEALTKEGIFYES